MKRWSPELQAKNGRQGLEDEANFGRYVTGAVPEIVVKANNIVIAGLCFIQKHTCSTVSISNKNSACQIIANSSALKNSVKVCFPTRTTPLSKSGVAMTAIKS